MLFLSHRSLKINLPFLFTYLKYSELNIPNTTNFLDGSVSQLKMKFNVCRSLKQLIKIKRIEEILGN